MPFRRQDISKTTRRSGEDGVRRLYPRMLRDRSFLPRIDAMIAYLEEMVGQRRGDLQPDAVLDLIGDTKMARCLLGCLAPSYRYRSPRISEVIGEDRATVLAANGLIGPVDLRRAVFIAANREYRGGVAADREEFLGGVANSHDLTLAELDSALFLDAERNQVLVRYGPIPEAVDILARYNSLIVTSLLRHASTVTLTATHLDRGLVELVSTRFDVPVKISGNTVTIRGKRGDNGTWSGYGGRLARVVAHIIMASGSELSGEATVHLGAQSSRLVLDERVLFGLVGTQAQCADAAGILDVWRLTDAIAAWRKTSLGFEGWTVRRALEPLVVEGCVVVPELVLVRGDLAIPLVASTSSMSADTLAALHAKHPLVVLGQLSREVAMPNIERPEPEALLSALNAIAEVTGHVDARLLARSELDARRWLGAGRIETLATSVGGSSKLIDELVHATGAILVTGIGVFAPDVYAGLCDLARTPDSGAVGRLREQAFRLTENEAIADALTLRLLMMREQWAHPEAA